MPRALTESNLLQQLREIDPEIAARLAEQSDGDAATAGIEVEVLDQMSLVVEALRSQSGSYALDLPEVPRPGSDGPTDEWRAWLDRQELLELLGRWHQLHLLSQLADLVDQALADRLIDARVAGLTWLQLGEALGVSSQAAQQRAKRELDSRAAES